MRFIVAIAACAVSLFSYGQSLREANKLFFKYEYGRSTEMFEELAKEAPLPLEEYKRLGYGYYITGDFKKCLPISDSLLNEKKIEPFFYYMNGEANFGLGNYEKAKASYLKYQSLDNEYNVKNKIASCDLIKSEAPANYVKNELMDGNNSKANMTGERYLSGIISFSEVGQDSTGTFVAESDINDAELVLARPFVQTREKPQIISLDENFRDAAVTSFALNENTSEVWVTISRPLSTEPIDMVPHVYKGKFDSSTLSISELTPWMYSGYEDTTACAHAALNSDGNQLIFSKIGPKTRGADLYVSRLEGQTWTNPTPLAQFNTEGDEMYPLFLGDSLFSFSSDGHPGFGGLDIFKANISESGFGKPQHLLAPVNGPSDEFNFQYFADSLAVYTSNRAGGKGDDDMYFIQYYIKREPVVAEIPDSSEFYAFVNSFEAPIFYFDFDKYNLNDSLDEKLPKLIEFLENNQESRILIEGHTDKRGSKKYNLKLSKRRAEALKKELVKRGINADQIDVSGIGYSKPINDCGWCSEKMHAQNRYARINLIAR